VDGFPLVGQQRTHTEKPLPQGLEDDVMAKMRLDKFLKDIGIASRSELKDIIRSGRVTINGTVCKDAGQHIETEADVIAIDGQPVQYQAYVYLMMNKPKGVITATEDNKIETVIDLLPEKYRRMGYSLWVAWTATQRPSAHHQQRQSGAQPVVA
jgi:ribosomal 50S subunit-recycling heat shock protein